MKRFYSVLFSVLLFLALFVFEESCHSTTPATNLSTKTAYPEIAEGSVYINGTDMQLKDITHQMSALLNKKIEWATERPFLVTIISDVPWTKQGVFQMYLQILAINELATTATDDVLRVVPKTSQSVEEDKNFKTLVIQPPQGFGEKIKGIISTNLSNEARVEEGLGSEFVIVRDHAANIEKLAQNIRDALLKI